MHIDALRWMKYVETTSVHSTDGNSDHDILTVSDIPMICAFEGSSAGNVHYMSLLQRSALTSGTSLDEFDVPYRIPLITHPPAFTPLTPRASF